MPAVATSMSRYQCTLIDFRHSLFRPLEWENPSFFFRRHSTASQLSGPCQYWISHMDQVGRTRKNLLVRNDADTFKTLPVGHDHCFRRDLDSVLGNIGRVKLSCVYKHSPLHNGASRTIPEDDAAIFN